MRDETKYGRMIAFGEALPRIRKATDRDLALPGLPLRKVLAAVVRLLELSLIRVGNDEYAQSNRSYGLTTMRDRHVNVDGSSIRFKFRGKSGIAHEIAIGDRRLARIVRRCRDLPGQELFQFVDEEDKPHDVGSEDVNDYLREVDRPGFHGQGLPNLGRHRAGLPGAPGVEPFGSQTQAKKNIVRAIEDVAERLGNTPTVCRKCYVHPAVLESYLDGSMVDAPEAQDEGRAGQIAR